MKDKNWAFVGLVLFIGIIVIIIGIVIAVESSKENDGSYINCGCGCCPYDENNLETFNKVCLYRAKDNIDWIIIKDNVKGVFSTIFGSCKKGCSIPTKYVYCD